MTKRTVFSVQYWPTYSLLGVLCIMLAASGIFVYQNQQKSQVAESVSTVTSTTIQIAAVAKEVPLTVEDPWQSIFPVVIPMTIGDVEVLASVAKSWPDRIKGLSDTPYLPEQVVKLFVFDSAGYHSIWMKDMKYAIDIIWVDEAGKVVHLEKEAAPESYPAMFVPDVPATYVIEAVTGFANKNNVIVGSVVVLPKL